MKHCLMLILALSFSACTSMKNPARPQIPEHSEGYFFRAADGCNLFVYEYMPHQAYEATVFILSGITGINHHREKDLIAQLSNGKYRVVVMHPRGSGYSEGKRGDIPDFSRFLEDYVALITRDEDYVSRKRPVILFGHSMSCAVLLAVAEKTKYIGGAILVNPAYRIKASKGMSPGFGDYVKYAWYAVFARHSPVVNMAGNPAHIENKEDREEAEKRANDPLLVNHFSLHTMMQSRKIMEAMPDHAAEAAYPLLLLYGTRDPIVDPKGCALLYEKWQYPDKQYHQVKGGGHGRSTVKLADGLIRDWVDRIATGFAP